jgi:hypothetical protein
MRESVDEIRARGLRTEELVLENSGPERVEPRVLEEREDLVRELGLRGRKRDDRLPKVKAIAHVLGDHRSADRTELGKADPINASASSHRLELVVRHRHARELPKPLPTKPRRKGLRD